MPATHRSSAEPLPARDLGDPSLRQGVVGADGVHAAGRRPCSSEGPGVEAIGAIVGSRGDRATNLAKRLSAGGRPSVGLGLAAVRPFEPWTGRPEAPFQGALGT